MQHSIPDRGLIHACARLISVRRFFPSYALLASALLCFFIAPHASADDARHSLWSVQGKRNTVYILGSVHFLRADEQFPNAIETAYQDANTLVMELDMDDLSPLAAQGLTMQLGTLPPGETLQQHIGAEASTKLASYTQTLGVDASMLAPFRPWLAALTLTQIQLMKLGLNAEQGVEQRFVTRAAADHKEIVGLETLDQQLGLFAKLSAAQQTQFLLYSIENAHHAEEELQSLLTAWRTGDLATMTQVLDKGFKEFPALYGPLTVERNRRWMAPLEKMLADDKDYLVIVGVLHLAGKDGVLDLLQRKGYATKQL